MENYIIYLFYLAVILISGIIITSISNRMKFSNILFLVLLGYFFEKMDFNYFNEEIILVLSSIALIVLILEQSMQIDLKHIVKNFLDVIKFNFAFFIITAYCLTLGIFLMFDIPGKGFEQFVMCFLLSIILYGVDPSIAMEFLPEKKKRYRAKEMLEIEGLISGPIVVIASFFVINYLTSSTDIYSGLMDTLFLLIQQVGIAFLIAIFVAYILYRLLKNFPISKEMVTLGVISTAIAIFVSNEALGSNGSLSVAIFGLFFLSFRKKSLSKESTSLIAHMLYIIVFILMGMSFFFPSPEIWLKGSLLFIAYIVLRFLCILLFIKGINMKQKIFMALNVAKGIEVAIVLMLMKINFSGIPGIEFILSLGFMYFIYSYILSTVVTRLNYLFFSKK